MYWDWNKLNETELFHKDIKQWHQIVDFYILDYSCGLKYICGSFFLNETIASICYHMYLKSQFKLVLQAVHHFSWFKY